MMGKSVSIYSDYKGHKAALKKFDLAIEIAKEESK